MLLNIGLLILRLTVGLLFAAHGAQKLFGWFSGHGLNGHAQWMESMGLRPGRLWAWANGLAEFAGGLMLALGLLTPLAAAALIVAMVAAIVLVHWPKGLWNMAGGYEYNLTLIAAALALGLTGPGAFSLDRQLFIGVSHLPWFVGALVIGLLVLFAGMTLTPALERRRTA